MVVVEASTLVLMQADQAMRNGQDDARGREALLSAPILT
jgi:hypothetical protein